MLDTVLPKVYFEHWSKLILVLRYLSGAQIDRKSSLSSYISLSLCSDYLKEWVRDVSTLYGPWAMSLGVHLVSHLSLQVRLLGPLWGFNCFGFETFNCRIKRTIHSSKGAQDKEFMHAYVACSSVQAAVDRHVDPTHKDLCEFLCKCGFQPIKYCNAKLKESWIAAHSDVPTFLVDQVREYQTLEIAGERRFEIIEGGMLYRNDQYFYSLAHESHGASTAHFTNSLVLNMPGCHTEILGIAKRYLLEKRQGHAWVEVALITNNISDLPMPSFPWAKLAPADFSNLACVHLPVECISRSVFWIDTHRVFGPQRIPCAYVIDWVHKRSMDPSIPLSRAGGRMLMLIEANM